MRQIIIARKDLHMTPGKLAAQCAHASIAFITNQILNAQKTENEGEEKYNINIELSKDCVDGWICGIFTKTICQAKNRNQLLKAKKIAEDLGLVEGQDFFLIKDSCLTELEPEEIDGNGKGHTLTCIGFVPLPDEIAHKISKKFHLYM